jgi:PPOX class probable F420-dependent enzyme
MDVKNLAELYGAIPMDWAPVEARLAQGFAQAPETGGPNRHTCWLATLNPDGTPHVTGIGASWNDGALWFETGLRTRKARNVTRDPRCSLSLAVREFDITVEGRAELITDPDAVAEYAARAAAGGWPARVDDSGTALTADYSAQSAGKPPWHVFRIATHRATAVQTVEPFGATRWTFDAA